MQGKYGLAITAFVVENVSVPSGVEEAIDKRSSMAAVGNLNEYIKFQVAQGTVLGTSGVAGVATEAAIGVGIARDLGQISAPTPPPAASAPAAPTAPALDLLSPAQAAELLGVAEADVLARLEAGDLKGKKIGSVYRIPRQAIDDFLHG